MKKLVLTFSLIIGSQVQAVQFEFGFFAQNKQTLKEFIFVKCDSVLGKHALPKSNSMGNVAKGIDWWEPEEIVIGDFDGVNKTYVALAH